MFAVPDDTKERVLRLYLTNNKSPGCAITYISHSSWSSNYNYIMKNTKFSFIEERGCTEITKKHFQKKYDELVKAFSEFIK